MPVIPYLSFNGRCEEALAFYKQALDATIDVMMRFSDSPEPCPPEMVPPGSEHKIMHSSMTVAGSMVMATDGDCSPSQGFDGISLSLTYGTVEEVEKRFNALAEGGEVVMPLMPTFFSPSFGHVKDRFGVNWLVLVEPPMP